MEEHARPLRDRLRATVAERLSPERAAVTLVLVVVTLLFVAVRSLIGFARWRLQRELWRRDVARLSE